MPLIVFRESGITGGIFDPGVSDLFIHEFPNVKKNAQKLYVVARNDRKAIKGIVKKWAVDVHANFYEEFK